MIKFICIKPLYKNLVHKGVLVEVDFDEPDYHDGTYSIIVYRGDFAFRSSIHKLDLDHFITLAEWRQKQIDLILEE